MIDQKNLSTLAGATMTGADGAKIGKIVDVYESTDGSTDGTFVTVSTGMFGGSASFVPLHDSRVDGDHVVVPYDKELVKEAPRVEVDEELTAEEENRLYAHYSITTPAAAPPAPGRGAGQDVSGPNTDDAMTRSEEHLEVGTERVESGRVRLRKRVVTETETRTVPVSHDEVTIEREPITDGNIGSATDGPAISEEEHEVVLTAERPVVEKEAVPVERVRVGKETVSDEVTVSDDVRKEVIELDDSVTSQGRER